MTSKSESLEIQKATKDLEEISKEVETPHISETSSEESVQSDEEKPNQSDEEKSDQSDEEKSDQSDEEKPNQSDEEKSTPVNPPRIYLDLDNTLLHAIPTRSFHKKYKDRASKRKIAEALNNIKVYDMKDDDESYYLVFERPGLQPFLDYLFSNFTVCVWTAATKDYAAFIIDKILLSKAKIES